MDDDTDFYSLWTAYLNYAYCDMFQPKPPPENVVDADPPPAPPVLLLPAPEDAY